jgi:two-component system chemotaxis response regulator CheB
MPSSRDVLVIGGSAGAIEALFRFLAHVSPVPEVAIAVVMHRHPTFASNLGPVFSRRSPIPFLEPEGGERFEPGVIFLAPQDRHMTLDGTHVQVDRGPRQHHTRPSIDPLFRTAAEAYGRRVIGVLLSGNLSDGVGGLIEIKRCGGVSLVQDPDQAPFPSMPTNALVYDNVDLVFQIDCLWSLARNLVRGESVPHLLEAQETSVGDRDLNRPFWPAREQPLP